MWIPPSNRMKSSATVTSRSTVRSRGSGTRCSCTTTAATTNITAGAGTRIRSVNRFEKTAPSPTSPMASTAVAYCVVPPIRSPPGAAPPRRTRSHASFRAPRTPRQPTPPHDGSGERWLALEALSCCSLQRRFRPWPSPS